MILSQQTLCIFFLIVVTTGARTIEESKDTLLDVQVLFRHGDRTPIHQVTNDRMNFTWPFPPGILTNQGRTRAYKLGQFLAQRYETFLKRVSRFDITARSSIIPRCLESTGLVLAGLFPPKKDEIWSPNDTLASLWRPIPIETQPFNTDQVLAPLNCPATEMISLKNIDRPEIKSLVHAHIELITRVTKGANFSQDLASIFRIFDAIMCEKAYFGQNYVPPSWLKPDDFKIMEGLYIVGQKLLHHGSNAEDSLRYFRVRAGAFLRYSLDHFNKPPVSEGGSKIGVFGSHDTKIMDLMAALGFEMGFPGFSTTVVFERWSDSTGSEPYLKVYYIEPEKDFKVTLLPLGQSQRLIGHCQQSTCSMSKFNEAIRDLLTPDDCLVKP